VSAQTTNQCGIRTFALEMAYVADQRRHRLRAGCRLLAVAAPLLCVTRLLAPERSWVLMQGAATLRGVPAPSISRSSYSRLQRAASGGGTGEFDFGDYDLPEASAGAFEAEEVEGLQLAPPEAEVFLKKETGQWECTNCGFEYDPFFGSGEIAPGTQWKDIPSNFRCPDCKVSKDQFEPITEEIAGFAENQEYGLGVNTLTSGQKNFLIWGTLGGLVAVLMGGYFIE